MCVCVCQRERERKKEGGRERERERERASVRTYETHALKDEVAAALEQAIFVSSCYYVCVLIPSN